MQAIERLRSATPDVPLVTRRYDAPVLAGRVVVVAGGDEGAGREIADGLADLGAIIVDDPRRAADAFVYVPSSAALVREALEDLDEATWNSRGEALLRDALRVVQDAFDVMRDRGGRIVLVTPTMSLVGGAGFAPYAMAVEGMRALAKVAARQWGSAGITVNCVAP
jgi:3-oxoacyl-[acyl-carrier protein] reductase